MDLRVIQGLERGFVFRFSVKTIVDDFVDADQRSLKMFEDV